MSNNHFLDRVIATVKKHSMFSGRERILVGLSGGPDSVCLLHVLNALKSRFALELGAAYVDHGLRPAEVGGEIAFCRKLCEDLGILFSTRSVDVKSYAREQKTNVQEAARELRYRIFSEVSYDMNAGKIALGHTADDQAETLLMRLFRGSGSAGLSGIPPVRREIIRPLIAVRREEIEEFLRERAIGFLADSSNMKQDYLRNRIRISLVPMLREFNPDIIETLSQTAAIFRDEERYFDLIVTKSLMKLISRKTDSRIELFLTPFEIMDKVIMRRVLRRAIDETRGLRGIGFIHIEDVVDLIKTGKPGDRVYLPGGIRAIKEYSILALTSELPVTLGTCQLTVPGETVLTEAGILIEATVAETQASVGGRGPLAESAVFDADRLAFPLVARARRVGDFFYPQGFGRRKKLQDFFVDEKVPRDERGRIPIITSGEDVVWVLGYRGDDRFKVTESTKKVLRLDVKKVRD